MNGDYKTAIKYYQVCKSIDPNESLYAESLKRAKESYKVIEKLESYDISVFPKIYSIDTISEDSRLSIVTKGNKKSRFAVYQSPNTESAIVDKVPGNTKFYVFEELHDWIGVQLLENKKAYLRKKHVK